MADLNIDVTSSTIEGGSGNSLSLQPSGSEIVVIGNGVFLPDGTAANPSIKFNDDTNTGIYSPVNEVVEIVGDGKTIARFDANFYTNEVNYLTFVPTPTGQGPLLVAGGTDTNIDLVLDGKGTGKVSLAGIKYPTVDGTVGQALKTDGAGNLAFATFSTAGHTHTESEISDLGAYLTGITAESVGSLSDVSVIGPVTGELLRWDGIKWANKTLAESGIAATSHTHTMASITDSTWLSNITSQSIEALNDVASMVPTAGDILTWNAGGYWENQAAAGGGGADARIASAPATFDVAPVVATSTFGNLAFGDGAQVATTQYAGCAIGKGAYVNANQGIAINNWDGGGSYGCLSTRGIAMGYFSKASGTESSIALGQYTVSSGNRSVAIGHHSDATGGESVAIGDSCLASGSGSVAIGDGAEATSTNNIAIGDVAKATGLNSMCLASAGSKTAAGLRTLLITTQSNTASFNNDNSVIVYAGSSGGTATASKNHITMVGGRNNEIRESFGTVIGGNGGIAYNYGESAYSSDYGFSGPGDAQTSMVTMHEQTTDATPKAITITGTTGYVMENDSTYMFDVKLVARRSDVNGESAGYDIKFVIDRDASAATTAIVGGVSTTVVAEDNAAWDVTVTADTTAGGPTITVTGEAGKTIKWVAFCRVVKVTG